MNYLNKVYNKLVHSDYLKDISILVGGSLMAQIIAFLSLPILSRIYLPEDFGAYSTFITITGIFGLISNFLYDRAIILPKKDSDSLGIFIASIFFSFITFLVSLFVLLLLRPFLADYLFYSSSFIILLIPLRILQLGIFQAAEQVTVRGKKFKSIAIVRSSNSFLTSVFQISSNLFYSLNGGLIFSKVLSDIIATVLFIISNVSFFLKNIKKINLNSIYSSVNRYVVFPKFQLPSVFSNTLSQSLPIVFLTSFFSLEVAGFYGMSIRLLKQPTELIGSSTQNVFYQRASNLHNERKSILGLYKNTTATLAKVYLIPMLLVVLFAPIVFEFFLGSDWLVAGKISQILIFWCFFSFIKPPSMMVFNILKLQQTQFRIEFIQLILRISSLAVGYLFFDSYMISLALFVFVSVIVDMYILFFINSSLLKREKTYNIKSKPKVTFIISGLGQGGAERVISTVANACVGQGFKVEIISGYSSRSAYELNKEIIVHYLDFKRLNSKNLLLVLFPLVKRLFKIRHILKTRKPNVLISFGDATNVQSLIVNKFLIFNSAKQIISIRSNPEKLHILSKILVNVFYRFANLLVVQTSFVKNWSIKRFSNLKVSIVNNPVKIPSILRSEKTIDFLHVGTIKFEKNHKDLLKAFSLISNKIDKNSKLYLVGGIESERLHREIINLIIKSGIKDRVVFMGSQKDVNFFYERSKIFILPSLYEGMSNALLESMSHGLPSITTAYKGASDIIKSDYNGVIVPQRDIKCLAKTMLDLYNDKEKRNFIGKNAKQTIINDFQQGRIIDNWVEIIKKELL